MGVAARTVVRRECKGVQPPLKGSPCHPQTQGTGPAKAEGSWSVSFLESKESVEAGSSPKDSFDYQKNRSIKQTSATQIGGVTQWQSTGSV